MAREVWVPSTVMKELIITVLIWKTSRGPQEELSLASSRGGWAHSPGLAVGDTGVGGGEEKQAALQLILPSAHTL